MSKELDIAVARALGFRVVKDAANVRGCQIGTAGRNGFDLPYYSEDARLVAVLLKEIERRGLQERYVEAMIVIIEPDVTINDLSSELMPMWRLFNATPEQHCRAFIAVYAPVKPS